MLSMPQVFSTIATLLLHSFTVLDAAATGATDSSCHGKVCHPVEEYCSNFMENCDKCANICDEKTHNFHADTCVNECAEFNRYAPLKAEIHNIQTQQHLILILLTLLLALIVIRYAYKCIRWLRHKRCISSILRKLQPKPKQPQPGKDLGSTTIQNVMTIAEHSIDAPSQVYSVTAGAEGSVMTVTTPVSTRYPAENITPTAIAEEYSYDNQALAVTPVSGKPNGRQAF